jgi:hypothetical protein
MRRDQWDLEGDIALLKAEVERLRAVLEAIAYDHVLSGFIDRNTRRAREALGLKE